MTSTYYTPYFWQKPAWADFWRSANGGDHRVIHVQKEFFGIKISAYVYQYPWFLGQKYFYLPEGPVIHDLYYNRYTDADRPVVYPLNLIKEQQEQARKIRSALQLFFQALFELAKKEKAVFVKFDPDDTLSNEFGLQTRQDTQDFLRSLLGLSLIAKNTEETTGSVLVQTLPKQAEQLNLDKRSKILDSSRIQLSSKRIMYYACMVLNMVPLQAAKPATEPGQTPPYPFHQDLLVLFYEQNKEFWSARSSQTKTKTRKSLNQNWHVSAAKSEANFNAFWQVYAQTADRQSFTTHDRNYFWQFFQRDFSRVLIARDDQGQAQAVWLGLSEDDYLIYMYGGNTAAGLEKFGPHIIQLAAMQMACLENKTWYDLGGYEEGTGYGFFKEGYKGQLRHFPGGIDLVMNPLKYKSINAAIQLRKNKFLKKIFNRSKV